MKRFETKQIIISQNRKILHFQDEFSLRQFHKKNEIDENVVDSLRSVCVRCNVSINEICTRDCSQLQHVSLSFCKSNLILYYRRDRWCERNTT